MISTTKKTVSIVPHLTPGYLEINANNQRIVLDNGITIEVLFITPLKAQEFLKRNIENNRSINLRYVSNYAEEMASDKWVFNGDTIRFDKDGNLIDGQHRLMAIVKSGATIPCLVVTNLEKHALSTIDVGRKRSLGVILKMEYGITSYYSQKASVTKALLMPFRRSESPFFVSKAHVLTEQQLISLYFDNQEAIDFSVQSFGGKNPMAIVSSVVARAWYFENHQMLSRFLEVVNTGFANSEQEHAAVALHKFLYGEKDADSRLQGYELFQKTQNALKAFLSKKPIKHIKSYQGEYKTVQSGIHWIIESDAPYIDSYVIKQAKRNQKTDVNDLD